MNGQPPVTGVQIPLFGFDSTVVPDIDFCQKDSSVIESQVISNYENYYYLITKIAKTLARGDPVRLFLLSIIYQLVVQRSIVDSTGKENLLKYSHGADLDNLGAKWSLQRTKPVKATAHLLFSIATPLTTDSVVPIGTKVQSGDGKIFGTTQEGNIIAGTLSVEVASEAEEAGSGYNGMVPGQIFQLVSWSSPFLVTAVNTTTSSGGADTEQDDHYRARIWMAPEMLTTAGPVEQYEAFAASANADIMDVSVYSGPEVAGQVYIYPLMKGGELPTQAVLDQVYAACNADRVRPLTDQVFVLPPVVSSVTATVHFWITSKSAQFSADIEQAVLKAYDDWKIWQCSKIGRDVNPSKMDQMMVDAGAKRTVIDSPVFTVLDQETVAQINPASICVYEGLEDE